MNYRKLALIIAVIILCCITFTAYGEANNSMIPVTQLDNGYWIDAYKGYLDYNYGDGYIASAELLDVDLDGQPELVIIEEWGRWDCSGRIVKITEDETIIYEDVSLFGADITFSLCLDSDGNACWYEKEFSAGTGLQAETIRKVEFTEIMKPIRVEWLTYTSEQMEDPETGFAIVPTGYYVNGESVDYDTYRREDLKRRQLVPIYTVEICSHSYPDAWDEMVEQSAVLNLER